MSCARRPGPNAWNSGIVDGDGAPRPLATDAAEDLLPRLSPDGTRLAFTSVTPPPEEKERLPPDADPNSKQAKPPFVTERLRTRSDGTPGWASPKRMHLSTVRTDAGSKPRRARTARSGWAGDALGGTLASMIDAHFDHRDYRRIERAIRYLDEAEIQTTCPCQGYSRGGPCVEPDPPAGGPRPPTLAASGHAS
jgi:hypothetical protein